MNLEQTRKSERGTRRSEEHTSELQSPYELVCRLLLEKKNRDAMAHRRHLGEHRHGDLVRRPRADIEAHGNTNQLDLVGRDVELLQALESRNTVLLLTD